MVICLVLGWENVTGFLLTIKLKMQQKDRGSLRGSDLDKKGQHIQRSKLEKGSLIRIESGFEEAFI